MQMVDIILSINKTYANSDLLKIRQDDYGQTITAIVTDKANSPLDLSKDKIELKVKNGGTTLIDSATGDAQGTITYTINKQTPLPVGQVQAWFELQNGENRVSTQSFWLNIAEASEQVIPMADPLGGVVTVR